MPDDENAEESTSAEAPQPAKPAAAPKAEKPSPAEKAVARPGGGGLAAAGAGSHAVVIVQAQPTGVQIPVVSRRRVLQIGFWSALGAMMTGIMVTMLNSLYPRNVTGFGGSVFVGTVDQLTSQPGQKLHNLDAKAWIVRLTGDQVLHNPGAQEGSIIALYHKCVHLGCTVPWRPDFSREDPRNGASYAGWFLCPCHGSTYSDVGVRVFGPAPRSLDTFELTITDGKMTVNTSKIMQGDASNGTRAILPG
jgi:cytochrome b6-f complex iron-sulfur subunit